MRIIFSAFIAGEILFLFLAKLPSNTSIYVLILIALVNLLLLIFSLKLRKLVLFNLGLGLVFGSIFCGLLGFIWTFYLSQSRLENLLPESLEGVNLIVDGVIDGLPQDTNEGRRFTLKVISWRKAVGDVPNLIIDSSSTQIGFPKRISLGWYTPRDFFHIGGKLSPDFSAIPELIPGQRWLLPVKLKQPRGLLNPHAFDYELWMFMQNLGANGNVRISKNSATNEIPLKLSDFHFDAYALVERVRWQLRRKILNAFSKEAAYAGVLVALVIGDQNSINQEDWKIFNATGIGHLISISGLHVTMLAGFGAFLAQFLWRRSNLSMVLPAQKIGVLFGLLTAFIYSLLAGFQIPAQRTMFMVAILALALWTGRLMKAFDVWWWALLLVMFLNPWSIYTPGFWLSFAAVALILYSMPSNKQNNQLEDADADWIFLKKIKESFGQACRVQLVVTVGLIPISLWWFSQISSISPIANAFAIPLVSFVITPMAMLGAFLPGFIGSLFLRLSHWVLEIMIYPLKEMADFSWSVIYAAKPSWLSMLLALFGVYLFTAPGSILHRIYLRLVGLCLCLFLFISGISRINDRIDFGDFRALVWDIGQGTAVLIKTQNHHLLYDAGPVSGRSNDPGLRTILPYFRSEGISQLDMLAISHKDSDHIGGVESIVKTIVVKDVVGSIPASHNLMNLFENKSVPAKPCQAGNHWVWDGVEFIVWHPGPKTTFDESFHQGRPNELSCVIEVRNQHFSFWLTGDIERIGEGELVARLEQDMPEKRDIDSRIKVLMAPHHGSKTSSSILLLNSLAPDWAFSQSGYKNRYNHPHPKIMARYRDFGLNLLDTSLTGAQIWNFEQKNLNLEEFRNSDRRIWHR